MTVSTTHIENEFTADGSQTVFNFTFHTLSTDHIEVYKDDVLQVAGFTKTLNANQEQSPGGNVTFTVAPALNAEILIQRVTPITQAVAFTGESRLNTEALETALDKTVLLLQEAAARTQGPTGATGATGAQGPSGDIGGPVSSTDGAIPLWDGALGNLLQEGLAPGNDGDTIQVVAGAWAVVAAVADIPSGTIVLWDTNLAAVPSGWEPMDGRTVTINGLSKVTLDTRGKYVLAAAEADTGSSGYTGATVRPGTIAGTKTHTHGNSGTVTVAGTTASGSVSSAGIAVASGGAGTAAIQGTLNFTGNNHAHVASISGSTQANAESVRPIECALLLIVKVD